MAVVRAPGAAGGPDPSQPRGGEPGWRAVGGRAGGRASCLRACGAVSGGGPGPGPGSRRPGGWRSGTEGLKVRQAAGRARGGLRAALWLAAPAGARGSPGASPEASPGSGRRGSAAGMAGERSQGSDLACGKVVPLASGTGLVPEAWRGQGACSAAEGLVEPADSWNITCVRSLLEMLF